MHQVFSGGLYPGLFNAAEGDESGSVSDVDQPVPPDDTMETDQVPLFDGTPTGEEHNITPSPPTENSNEPPGKKRTLWRSIREIVIILLIAALLAVILQSFVIKSFVIPSGSMSPTLQVGDRVMVERVTYYFRKPRRGDVIVFRYPPREPNAMNTNNPFYWPFEQIGETFHLTHRGTTPFVKRVIATEGETVELRNGKLYIDEDFVKEGGYTIVEDNSDYGPVKVPEGMVFCLGDNRPQLQGQQVLGNGSNPEYNRQGIPYMVAAEPVWQAEINSRPGTGG